MSDKSYTLIGTVESSKTKHRGCGGLITLLTISIKVSECGLPKEIELNIPGRHRVNVGEKIKADYEKHTGVYWCNYYKILDKKGKVLHSDIAD